MLKVKSRAPVVGGPDSHLGSHLISLGLVRPGYRHVALESYEGGRLTPASIFLRINRVELSNTVRPQS